MQELPVLSEANNEACKSSLTYWFFMAFCNLGNQHRGHRAQGTKRVQILIRHDRHIHQVNESYAGGEYYARSSGQVPTEYHIQVRRTQEGSDR
jgi:hypothetical protein